MAVVKIILFNSPSKQLKDGTFPVSLKITHQRKRKYFSLNKYCYPNQWNKDSGQFVTSSEARKDIKLKAYKGAKKENDALDSILEKAKDIIRDFDRFKTHFTFKAFEDRFLNRTHTTDLKEKFTETINQLIEANKISTASPYLTTLNAIIDFVSAHKNYSSKGLNLTDIDYKFLTDFEHWLRTSRGCKDTSISVYMRTLRATMNRAIKEKILKREFYPFDEYSVSKRLNHTTQKRAINKGDIEKILLLELPENSPLKLAQDIFIFSFYTRGMNFVDIAYLTPENVVEGRIKYQRMKTKGKSKTPHLFDIKILPPVKKVLDHYIKNKVTKGNFIFPIFDDSIHKTEKQKYNRRKTALRQVNRNLRVIAEMVGLENLNLTSYVSRHTYATTLKKAGVSISVISEAMGHQTEKVTQTYLKQFENTDLDKADENIL